MLVAADVVLLVSVAVLLAVAVRGVIAIVFAGFFMTAIAAVVAGALTTTVLSVFANMALSMSLAEELFVFRALLVALSQPTLGSIALCGIMYLIVTTLSTTIGMLDQCRVLITALTQRIKVAEEESKKRR